MIVYEIIEVEFLNAKQRKIINSNFYTMKQLCAS